MNYIDEEKAPQIFAPRNFAAAAVVHVLIFVFFWIMALPLRSKETVIPIELTFEAPPDEVAEEPAPTPKPVVQPKPKIEEPPKVEDRKVEAVEKVVEKPKPRKKEVVKRPDPPKEKPKEEVKKPEPPKKTAKELREERLRKMREGAKVVKNPKPPPVVGTGKNLEKDWQKLLAQGYKPGATTQLAANEEQRCISLIRAAFYAKWDRPPWSSSLREIFLEVEFGPGGRVMRYRITESSGDARADKSVLTAASLVHAVYGLNPDFLSKYKNIVTVRFKVTPGN